MCIDELKGRVCFDLASNQNDLYLKYSEMLFVVDVFSSLCPLIWQFLMSSEVQGQNMKPRASLAQVGHLA